MWYLRSGASCSSARQTIRAYKNAIYSKAQRPVTHVGQVRTFLNLGNILPTSREPSSPKKVREQIVLPYTPKELYSIVSDVDSYHHFLPYCLGSRVIGPSDSPRAKENRQNASSIVDAELTIGFSAFRESYVSEVSMRPNEWVLAHAKPSPLFQELHTAWHFRPLPAGASIPRTEVTFTLAFAFSSPFYAAVAGQVFEKLSSSMLEAFQQRARSVYGLRRS